MTVEIAQHLRTAALTEDLGLTHTLQLQRIQHPPLVFTGTACVCYIDIGKNTYTYNKNE